MKTNFLHSISGIYAITPDRALDLDAIEKVIVEHNIGILQYRHKTLDAKIQLNEATQLQRLCTKHHTLFIINDDSNLAQKIHADGVHLGKNDGSIQQARKQLGADTIIGVSCYDDIDLAKKAQQQGADYVAFGALFSSSTKPNTIHCPLSIVQEAKQNLTIPIVGIGGIDFNNQQSAVDAGCDAVAMINALWD
ncbi:MAG: Thiamine-phosphate synthase [Catillopecten margaritatus gill symbiont]|uniref:Thiamine-phosphate synthase n=1 Tax=Catillopecten margaritatus gill symbiont TaxID=3083288 RepID=A0AAU6PGJ7_9GAMM